MGYIQSHLRSLEEQHRKLDEEIKHMIQHHWDEALIKRAKQQKLRIRDDIDQIRKYEESKQRSNYQP